MSVEARRAAVEHGLTGALRFVGRAEERFGLADRMQRYSVPGISIAVIDDGELSWAAGFGSARPGEAMTPDSLLQAASISKAVAAVGVLALVEHGTLDLDTDVNSYLRSWRLPDSEHTAHEPVTLRRLLSHTAGTTVPGFPGYPAGTPVPAVPDVLSGTGGANTPAVQSFAAPGTVAQYSGGGSTLVQLLVCDVTGRDFVDLMHDLVLAPFGMAASGYHQPPTPAMAARAAFGHDGSGAPVPGGWHVYPELQAAGLWTTPSDLARWVMGVQAILHGRTGGPISPDTARLMTTSVGLGPFGLGPELGGEGRLRRFGHSGANEGYKSQLDGLVELPTGAVVMSNGENGTTLVAEVRRAIANEYGWGDLGAPPIQLADVPDDVLRRYTGRYDGPFGRKMKVELADGQLFSPAPYGRRHLYALGPTTFLDEETGATLEVVLDGDRVQRMAVLVEGLELMAFTPEEAR